MATYSPSKITKDGNTYNFRDNTKIPLSGSNQISGSLIPATDNSIDIGSSTKNIKKLYTKGITLDGKTIDTDANGNMTYDGHIVDTIEEQGNEYIRYSNGIQICWGYVSAGTQTTKTFPKSFSTPPSVSVTVDSSNLDSKATAACTAQAVTVYNSIAYYGSFYIAIGRWK